MIEASKIKTIFIYGEQNAFPNYVNAFHNLGAEVLVTTDDSRASECDALLLPGGGDVRPSLYGQEFNGSNEPDDARDAAEMRVIARFLAMERPIFGICRGLQIINIVFGGTLVQDIPGHSSLDSDTDRVHMSHTDDPWLQNLYGAQFPINSAHHQVIDRLGAGLNAIQWSEDGYVEALKHRSRPIYAVQWHPERMCFQFARPDTVDGSKLLRAFLDMI